MKFYARYPGDYARDTQDLSLAEHGAYVLLLDYLYGTERVLPKNPLGLYRVCRAHTDDEKAAVDAVIARFFTETADGFTNARFERDIVPAKARIHAARQNGARGGRPRKDTEQEPGENPLGYCEETQSETQVEPSAKAHQLQTVVTLKPKGLSVGGQAKEAARAKVAKRPDDVSDEVWQAFKTLRAAKRAPVTDLALIGLRREAEKAGLSLQQAMTVCVQFGWQGFRAEWYAGRSLKALTASRTVHDLSTMNYGGVDDDGRF